MIQNSAFLPQRLLCVHLVYSPENPLPGRKAQPSKKGKSGGEGRLAAPKAQGSSLLSVWTKASLSPQPFAAARRETAIIRAGVRVCPSAGHVECGNKDGGRAARPVQGAHLGGRGGAFTE